MDTGGLRLDDLILVAIDKWGYGALVVGLILYLVLEGGLDLVTDYLSDKRRERHAKVPTKTRDR